jgi:hypothetical protein
MLHIHITHDKAVEFLKSCEALEGFISSDSILGRLMIAMRAALAADGVSVDVWQGDTALELKDPDSISKNTHVEALEHLANVADEIHHNNSCELPIGIHLSLTSALAAIGRK